MITSKLYNPILIKKSKNRWFIEYYVENDNGELVRFKPTRGLNRIKNKRARFEQAQLEIKALQKLFKEGWNPAKTNSRKVEDIYKDIVGGKTPNIIQAFESVYDIKSRESSKSTIRSCLMPTKEIFIKWIIEKELSNVPYNEITRAHISAFLSFLTSESGRNVGSTTRNNYLRYLNIYFEKMKEIYGVEFFNPCTGIKPIKGHVLIKNKAYTPEQAKRILETLRFTNPYLYYFVNFMRYSFLRPAQLCRLKIKHIDVNRGEITIPPIDNKDKTKEAIRPIIQLLQPMIEQLKLERGHSEQYIFNSSKDAIIGEFSDEEPNRETFSKRFKKHVKEPLNLGNEYTMYSFRHTTAIEIMSYLEGMKNEDGSFRYTRMDCESQLCMIMGHTNIETTRKYLRDHQYRRLEDYSSYIQIA